MISRENPARPTEIVGSVSSATPSTVDDVVRAARPGDYLSLLPALADALTRELEPLSLLLARESGKVLADCRGEISFAITYLRWVAENAPRVLASHEVDDAAGRLLTRRRPYGVVAAITPWNAPIILALLKIAPALAAGNAVVVKPSPLAPLTIDRAVRLMAACLPAGALAIVQGGAEVGAALASHPLVHKVAFTGGGAAAREVARSAATHVTQTVMELGGNDPAIFLPDAPLTTETMQRLVMASFATSGQVCMAAKRLYVHESLRDSFTCAYLEAAATVLRTGDPLTPGVTMGPLISAAAAVRVSALAGSIPLGTMDPGLKDGYFVHPTLAIDPPANSPLVTEEQFGPVVPLLSYRDIDEVIERANAGDLGLGASVWSADEEHAFAVASRIEAGFVFINTHNRTGMSLRAPFGGVKRSGFGREYGDEGLLEYAQTCVIHAPAAFRLDGQGMPATAYPC